MPEWLADGGGAGHMAIGRGPKGYLITVLLPTHKGRGRDLLLVEVWAAGIIEAIAYVQERLSVGEVVSVLKLWAE